MKWLNEQAWTLAGVALVIITLSGDTRTQALLISVAALGLQALSAAFKRDDEE